MLKNLVLKREAPMVRHCAGVKKSVICHECDENSVKTPLGCKKPFTSSCHQDVNGFLHPGGVCFYYIDFTGFFVVANF